MTSYILGIDDGMTSLPSVDAAIHCTSILRYGFPLHLPQ